MNIRKQKYPYTQHLGDLLARKHSHFHPLFFNLFVQEMCVEWMLCASQLSGAGDGGGAKEG